MGTALVVVVVADRPRVRFHERLPRHGELRRDLGRDPRALASPAVLVSAAANLAGAFVTTAVAKTVAEGIINTNLATEQTILAALFGAIVWNLLTWRLGLPSSSTHALIGGLVGAALVQSGTPGVQWSGLWHKVIVPGAASPVIGFAVAFGLLVLIYRLFHRLTPGVANRGFRTGQLFSGTWVAFTHGANDAQKTMGVIALALYEHGSISSFYIPTWVKVSAGLTIAAGTYVGGWRIIRTLGQRVYKMAARAWLRRPGRGRLDALRRHAFRLPDLDDTRRLGLGDGGRRDAPPLGRSLGSRRQHRLRLAADTARRRPRGSGPLLPGRLDLLAFPERCSGSCNCRTCIAGSSSSCRSTSSAPSPR